MSSTNVIKRISRSVPLATAANKSSHHRIIKVVAETSSTEPKVKKTIKTKTKTSEKVGKYGNPWQTKPTPPESDSLCKFYTSLLRQKPDSQMAMKWCLERGLLSERKSLEVMMALGINKSKH